jgi:hypothetical protein
MMEISMSHSEVEGCDELAQVYFDASFDCVRHFVLRAEQDSKPHSAQDASSLYGEP